MPISTTCQACDAKFRFRDDAAGKKVRCKSCGGVILIPTPDPDLDDLDDYAEPDEDEYAAPRVNTRSNRKKKGRKSTSVYLQRLTTISQSVGETMTWINGTGMATAAFVLYLLCFLAGFANPKIWLWTTCCCCLTGALIFAAGYLFLFAALIWHNIFLIFIFPLIPFFWIAILFYWNHEFIHRPARLLGWGVALICGGVAPMYTSQFMGQERVYSDIWPEGQRQRNQPAVAMGHPAPFGQHVRSGPQVPTGQGVLTGQARTLFRVADIPVPQFKLIRHALKTPRSGLAYYTVFTESSDPIRIPGSLMIMRVYLPRLDAPARSLGCVLIAPAGSNLISGKELDDVSHEDEIAPYVQAGLAVVHFSLDGAIKNLQSASEAQLAIAYRQFSAAAAGLVNARNAMAFVIQQLPEVDRNRIYIAGHSSAGSLALLFAEHEPSLRGCIAFAPASELPSDMNLLDDGRGFGSKFPGIRDFIIRSAPLTHVACLNCPVFLFHGQGDAVVPIDQSNRLAAAANNLGKSVTFSQVAEADHYTPMVQRGIPQAIEWLKSKFGEPGDGRSAPMP